MIEQPDDEKPRDVWSDPRLARQVDTTQRTRAMIQFNLTAGGLEVIKHEEGRELPIGGIDRTGFYTDSVVGPKAFTRLTPVELRIIADRAEEHVAGR